VAIDTFSPNRNYVLPATGNDVNTWGPLLNGNFSAIDSNISALLPVSTTGGTTTFTTGQAANLYYNVNGALTSNAILVFPGVIQTFFIVANNTTGAFTLTIQTENTGTTQVQNQGIIALYYSDGTNINLVATNTPPQGLALIGEIKNWPVSTLPPNYVWANGQAISRTTFAALFAVYSTFYGPGDGSTTFNVPDLRGNIAAGADAMGGAAAAGRLTSASIGVTAALGVIAGSQQMQSHTHPIDDPSHAHTTLVPFGIIANNAVGGNGTAVVSTEVTSTDTNTTGIEILSAGSGNSQNVQPTFVTNYIIFAGA
jgi:microcystin-dependent protein